jgi:hypothetical protein
MDRTIAHTVSVRNPVKMRPIWSNKHRQEEGNVTDLKEMEHMRVWT